MAWPATCRCWPSSTPQKMAADPNTNISAMQNLLPIQILHPEDIANAVAYLISDEAKFVTGTQRALDAGFSVR